MGMKAAISATCCGVSSCDNNRNRRTTLACSFCGRCGDCVLHSTCEADSGGLVAPVVSVCAGDDCMNNTNAVQVLACRSCGRCGDCRLHNH
jgi:hypothetical protein